MSYQIDQSGKIEDTAKNTVIALSNTEQYSVIISTKSKRLLQTLFRLQNKPGLFVLNTFSALVSFVLYSIIPNTKIVIDIEYPGHSDYLKEKILQYCNYLKLGYTPLIEFRLIGRRSGAHAIAYNK